MKKIAENTNTAESSESATKLARADNCFDFLRLFAAVCVVVRHSGALLGGSFLWYTPNSRIWFSDGVPLFFILSGMLVYRSCEKCVTAGRPLRQFFTNRFLRVAPAIAIIVPVTLLGLGAVTLNFFQSREFFTWQLANLILVPVYHPEAYRGVGVGVINGSLWTIPAEFSFYLVVPLLFLIERRYGLKRMLQTLSAVAAFGLTVRWALESRNPESMLGKAFDLTFAPHMVFFALGIFWLKFWHKAPQSGRLALTCLVVYTTIRYFPHALPFEKALGPAYKIAWGLPLSYLTIWFGYNGPKVLSRLTKRIGDLSYGVYVWHMVLVNLFMYIGVPEYLAKATSYSDQALIWLVLGSTLILAYASWHLIEKPALKLKPFTARETQQPSDQSRVRAAESNPAPSTAE
jgi:peptidoglycan/LPS O-acetylase OafA/YrhL